MRCDPRLQDPETMIMTTATKPDRSSIRRLCGAHSRRVSQARSAAAGAQPGHVHRFRRQHADDRVLASTRAPRRNGDRRLRVRHLGLALVHGVVRRLSPRRWPKAAAKRRRTRSANSRATCIAKKLVEPNRDAPLHRPTSASALAQRRHRTRRSRRFDPGRRRDHRRRRVGR